MQLDENAENASKRLRTGIGKKTESCLEAMGHTMDARTCDKDNMHIGSLQGAVGDIRYTEVKLDVFIFSEIY